MNPPLLTGIPCFSRITGFLGRHSGLEYFDGIRDVFDWRITGLLEYHSGPQTLRPYFLDEKFGFYDPINPI
jgi:hypothetical protein